MKKIQTQNHRDKTIGNGSRSVNSVSSSRPKKRSIVPSTSRKNSVSSKSGSRSQSVGKRSGCSGCSRSSGRR